MAAKTIGIISIKGGVGKTSVASALAGSLANKFSKKVLVVDGNFSAPNLAMHLGINNPDLTMHHVLDGKIRAKEAVYQTGHGFDILPGALAYGKIEPLKLAEKISELKRFYDIILVDSSPNLNREILAAMLASDELLVVTTPDHVTLASTIRAVKIAKAKRTPITGIILNKVHNKDFEISLEDIEDISGVNVLAVIPHETGILEAACKSTPSTMHKKSESTHEYEQLAASLIGKSCRNSWFGDFFRKMRFAGVEKQEVNRDILRNSRANLFF